MNRYLVVMCVLASGALVGGCGRKYKGEKRYAVSGKVTVDGQPMEHGLISFLPQAEGIVSGGPISSGAYAIPEEKGPNAGKYQVKINWNKPTGRRVKDDYGDEMMDE